MFEMEVPEYLRLIQGAIGEVPIQKVVEATELIIRVHENGGSIFVMGNGGSAATASHFTNDMNKAASEELSKKFKVICLNDNVPLMLAYGNDIGFEDIFVEQLRNFLRPGDAVIGISGSGKSRNVIKALEYAKALGVETICLSGFDGGIIAQMVNVAVVVPINDMQVVEDLHMVVAHSIMRSVRARLRGQERQRCQLRA